MKLHGRKRIGDWIHCNDFDGYTFLTTAHILDNSIRHGARHQHMVFRKGGIDKTVIYAWLSSWWMGIINDTYHTPPTLGYNREGHGLASTPTKFGISQFQRVMSFLCERNDHVSIANGDTVEPSNNHLRNMSCIVTKSHNGYRVAQD